MIRVNEQHGFTIVEVVATGVISVVAFLALYIGMVYAEGRMNRDYHTRSAMMIASGELDIQTYWIHTFKKMNNERRVVSAVIDDSNNGLAIKGKAELTPYPIVDDEIISDQRLYFMRITSKVSWKEPSLENEVLSVQLVEDYYDQSLGATETDETGGGTE
jgi:hypothetical protein